MSLIQASEAVVLRTWPVHEADLIVSLFTREYGKVKGIAKSAMKSRKRFGGTLEPMTLVRASYAEKPRQELVRLDSMELVRSPLSDSVDYARAAALAFYSEALEELLPDHGPEETVFRLLVAVLEYTRAGQPWLPVTYFSLWLTRLMGWLPELTRCMVCSEPLQEGDVYFHAQADGLTCGRHRRGNSSLMPPESHVLALRILRAPISQFAEEEWPRKRASALRRFAIQSLERHVERRMTTAEVLARLGG